MNSTRSMTRDRDHVYVEDYDAAARRADGPGTLGRHVQEHLVAQCPDCEDAWRKLGELRSIYLDRVAALTHPLSEGPSRKGLAATPADVEAQEAHTTEVLRLYRNIRGEKYELLRTPPGKRAAKIRRARSRFRSPLLAEFLIEHVRKLVRSDPVEAAEIASLVPQILAWTQEAEAPPDWAPSVLARAAAHHANALRVAGDLRAAERAFVELRRRLAIRPLGEPALAAEIASLEASLYIDQRRLDEAGQRLEHAAIGYRAANDRLGLAKTTISQATLLQTLGQPEELLGLLERHERLLQDLRDPYLEVCAVTVRVNALCDLKRFAVAGELLDASLDAYETSEDLNVGAIYRFLRGRIALGNGDLESAEQAFEGSRDAMLALGRAYDAALSTLYLAEALLAAGKNRKLALLARGMVAAFRAQGVEGEVLAALQLLARAVVAETLNATLLAELRHKLTRPVRSPRLAPLAD